MLRGGQDQDELLKRSGEGHEVRRRARTLGLLGATASLGVAIPARVDCWHCTGAASASLRALPEHHQRVLRTPHLRRAMPRCWLRLHSS